MATKVAWAADPRTADEWAEQVATVFLGVCKSLNVPKEHYPALGRAFAAQLTAAPPKKAKRAK